MTPTIIKQARLTAGLTQTQAAQLVHRTLRNWQQWEAGERPVDKAAWELFNIKIRASDNARSSKRTK